MPVLYYIEIAVKCYVIGVYLLLNKGDLTWFLRVLMLMMSGVYEQDSNVTQLGNFKFKL